MSLTYDKQLQICAGLGVHVTELLSGNSKQPAARTRRSVTSGTTTLRQLTRNYDYHYLATDLVRKRMVPILAHARARTLAEFGPLTRHAGEEFLIVLKGEIELHTDQYAPVRLKAGERVLHRLDDGPRLSLCRRRRSGNAVRLLRGRAGKDLAQHYRRTATDH
ncbi:cupin domain-containing protein [Ensifer canadensis]